MTRSECASRGRTNHLINPDCININTLISNPTPTSKAESVAECKQERVKRLLEKTLLTKSLTATKKSPSKPPSPAKLNVQSNMNLCNVHLHLHGTDSEPIKQIKNASRAVSVSMGQIKNIRWIGQRVLDCLVHEAYEQRFISQMREINPKLIIQFDAAEQALTNAGKKERAKKQFQRSASVAINASNSEVVENDSISVLEEMDLLLLTCLDMNNEETTREMVVSEQVSVNDTNPAPTLTPTPTPALAHSLKETPPPLLLELKE